jgi:hypothetical protein
VAIAERDGYILKEDGIDIAALKKHFDEEGTVLGFDGAETHVRCRERAGGEEFTGPKTGAWAWVHLWSGG